MALEGEQHQEDGKGEGEKASACVKSDEENTSKNKIRWIYESSRSL